MVYRSKCIDKELVEEEKDSGNCGGTRIVWTCVANYFSINLACRAHHSPRHVTPAAIQYRMRLMNILCMNFARGSLANERVATMAVE